MARVGVLGSGDVAKVLAVGLQQQGHEVMIGSRTPAKLNDWANAQRNIVVGDFQQTAAFGEIVVLAVLGRAAEPAVGSVREQLAGKVVIDATNPIDAQAPDQGVLRYFTTANESLMERLQALAPDAKFVKAFNSVGNTFMIHPQFPGGRPTMFICGNDAAAKQTVTGILDQLGWDAEDAGLAPSARPIEALCQLWCAPGFLRGQWTHAFKLLKL